MPTFTYEAKDGRGNTISGIIEAGEARGAAGALREQGLWATRIEPVGGAARKESSGDGGAPAGKSVAPFLTGVPLPALAVMYSQFGTLMDAGVPIAQAMHTLAEQTIQPRLREILRECADAVNAGHALTSVLERYPTIFTPIQIELMRAGETSGMLDLMARRISTYIEKEIEIRRRLKRETLYPKIVLFVAWLVGGLLIYLRAGGAGGVRGFWLASAILVGGTFAIWWLLRYLNQYPALGALWDQAKMTIPGVGGVVRRYATARFARALGALYAGGVLLPRAVEAAARACGNRAISRRILAHAGTLNTGEGVSEMLHRAGMLSPLAVQMARTGEQTGNLDAMMDKVADHLEGEADVRSHQLAVVAGVAALLIAGLVVLLIALSAYVGGAQSMLRETG